MHTDHGLEVLDGAEPFSADGGAHGALVLHGLTGSPQSMRGLARSLAEAGFSVELPRLPGHGTSVDDMATTSFADWSAAADHAYSQLATRCTEVVVIGLSMGATLAAWLAARHPEIAALVMINGALASADPAVRAGLEGALAQGQTRIPGPGNDIADPNETELAYPEVPLRSLLSLFDALDELQACLPAIHCPSLVIVSEQDHVVPPESSAHFAAVVGGPVERMVLSRSYHVATLDDDHAELEARVVDFATRVTARSAEASE
ncbi:MAG TPA: alpha/beta fold hydrolase [Acidimicrobiia bacterium]|nr:alpha/beta fold hydrolase [Acidimicrobiia bacterium]